jgi:hypothetical protein
MKRINMLRCFFPWRRPHGGLGLWQEGAQEEKRLLDADAMAAIQQLINQDPSKSMRQGAGSRPVDCAKEQVCKTSITRATHSEDVSFECGNQGEEDGQGQDDAQQAKGACSQEPAYLPLMR